jgi:hypothetical protein
MLQLTKSREFRYAEPGCVFRQLDQSFGGIDHEYNDYVTAVPVRFEANFLIQAQRAV